MAIDEYANRFYSDDLVHKLIYLVYTFGVFIQVLNINSVHEGYSHSSCGYSQVFGAGFVLGILLTRISIIATYAVVMYHNIKARDQFLFDTVRWAVTTFIMILLLCLHAANRASDFLDVACIGAAVTQETCFWIFIRLFLRKRYTYPVDLKIMQARWVVWVMIVIGEAIIQMLNQEVHEANLVETYGSTLSSLILVFSLSMHYSDACQREWFDHAFAKSALGGVAWIWLHPPMTFVLFTMGVALKMLFTRMQRAEPPGLSENYLLSVSIGLATAILTLIRSTHLMVNEATVMDGVLLVLRLVISGIQISVMAFKFHSFVLLIVAQTVLSLFFNLIDIYEAHANSSRPTQAFRRLSLPGTS